MRSIIAIPGIAACLLLLALPANASPLPIGKAELSVSIDGTPITVHTYKPTQYAGGALLLTLHGVGRNAASYRDHAIPLAERSGFLVLAPLFDSKRFPTWRYQHAGIVRPDTASATAV